MQFDLEVGEARVRSFFRHLTTCRPKPILTWHRRARSFIHSTCSKLPSYLFTPLRIGSLTVAWLALQMGVYWGISIILSTSNDIVLHPTGEMYFLTIALTLTLSIIAVLTRSPISRIRVVFISPPELKPTISIANSDAENYAYYLVILLSEHSRHLFQPAREVAAHAKSGTTPFVSTLERIQDIPYPFRDKRRRTSNVTDRFGLEVAANYWSLACYDVFAKLHGKRESSQAHMLRLLALINRRRLLFFAAFAGSIPLIVMWRENLVGCESSAFAVNQMPLTLGIAALAWGIYCIFMNKNAFDHIALLAAGCEKQLFLHCPIFRGSQEDGRIKWIAFNPTEIVHEDPDLGFKAKDIVNLTLAAFVAVLLVLLQLIKT